MSACEKDKFDVILGHGEEGETEGEMLLAFTINDKFSSEEEQGNIFLPLSYISIFEDTFPTKYPLLMFLT